MSRFQEISNQNRIKSIANHKTNFHGHYTENEFIRGKSDLKLANHLQFENQERVKQLDKVRIQEVNLLSFIDFGMGTFSNLRPDKKKLRINQPFGVQAKLSN